MMLRQAICPGPRQIINAGGKRAAEHEKDSVREDSCDGIGCERDGPLMLVSSFTRASITLSGNCAQRLLD
jgi:hypothetical protein